MEHLGIYVHIPFCVRKCAYCDFASFAGREGDMARYTDVICGEMRRRAGEAQGLQADTVFFGGGTPSVLPPDMFERIVGTLRRHYAVSPEAEFTVECNPGTLTAQKAETFARCGVNRLSMGMQCAQPHLLRRLNRIHTPEQVRDAVETARAAGIARISLDLMLGLPGQTMEDMAETLREAIFLAPEHISCYALIVEDGTPLQRQLDAGEITLPGEDAERDMYEYCRRTLEENGFEQYEISNFARPGGRCRHNENCWRYQPYLGFGCAAHGFLRGERRANPVGLDEYLGGEAPVIERILPKDAMFEYMMLGLRLTQGVEEMAFERMFGVPLWTVYGDRLAQPLRDGRLVRGGGRIYLSKHGMDVMNSVLVTLL